MTVATVNYQTDPSQYKHWKLSFNGPVATLAVDIDENGGLRPGCVSAPPTWRCCCRKQIPVFTSAA